MLIQPDTLKNFKLLIVAGLLCSGCNTQPPVEFNREEVLNSFELDSAFQMEVIAHEPLIADPVAMEIDEYGRVYVIQMHGYPLDKSGSGSIKLLSDTDGDGVMDQSVVFAEGLTLPNGIMRWKKGVIVTDAPYVYYLEDSDGDGKADIKEIVLSGFALSNPQHKVNSPVYGLDNWIYLANEPYTAAKIYVDEFGDTGTEVRYHQIEDGPALPPNANGRSVRFRPDQRGLEMLSTATQFSNAQDAWGRHFFGNNTNHIYHEVIQSRYLTRNKHLSVPSSIHTMSGYGMPAKVYPITESAEHQIFTDVGVFTSACGTAIYGGDLFPETFDGVAFIGEPVSNVVHAAKINNDGVSFRAERFYEKKEFLASRDAWFRPVNHYVGPDGALYVIDYHRRFIEHPEWMADDVVQSGALYDGRDKGRIFRITPKGTPAADWINGLKIGDLSAAELVTYLAHSNAWHRKTAQRLLVDRQDKSVIEPLKALVSNEEAPLGQLHAAWTLEGMGALTAEVVEVLIESKQAELRENGIVLGELLAKNQPQVLFTLLKLKNDADPRVRFQLLCTIGSGNTAEIKQVQKQLLFNNIANPWMQVAALSAQDPDYHDLLKQAISNFHSKDNSYRLFVERLASMQLLKGDVGQVKQMIQQALDTKDRHQGAWQSALLAGLNRKVQSLDYSSPDFDGIRTGLLEAAFKNTYPAVRLSSLNLLKQTGLPDSEASRMATARSVEVLKNPAAPTDDRLHALSFLSIGNPEAYESLYYSLLNPRELLSVQKASLSVLSNTKGTAIAEYLRDHWNTLSPELRDNAIGIFLTNEERTVTLIESLENGKIDPSSLDFYRQIYLMTLSNESLRQRTRKIFKAESKNEERKKVVDSYKKVLTTKGNADRGMTVFENNCSACHQISGEFGTAYGPDLGTIRNRRPESILTDILDPSLSIADGFDLWEIVLTDGSTRQGVISTETPTTIALSIYGSSPEIINRNEIESMRALGTTIMPAGLESAISESDMADLLAFLKKAN